MKKLGFGLAQVGILGVVVLIYCGLGFSQAALLQPGTVNKAFDPVELARAAYLTNGEEDSSRLSILDGSPADQPQSTLGKTIAGSITASLFEICDVDCKIRKSYTRRRSKSKI